jgi:hypothetical protein
MKWLRHQSLVTMFAEAPNPAPDLTPVIITDPTPVGTGIHLVEPPVTVKKRKKVFSLADCNP